MLDSTKQLLEREQQYLNQLKKELLEIGAVQQEQTWLATLYAALKAAYEAAQERMQVIQKNLEGAPRQSGMSADLYQAALRARERAILLELPSDVFRARLREETAAPIHDLFLLLEQGRLEAGHMDAITHVLLVTDREVPAPEKAKSRRSWVGYLAAFLGGILTNDFVFRGGLLPTKRTEGGR